MQLKKGGRVDEAGHDDLDRDHGMPLSGLVCGAAQRMQFALDG